MTTDNNWQRLGNLLIARRIELGFKSRTAFAETKGFPNTRVVAAVENAERKNFSRGTLAQIELAYGWRVGSVDNVLAGGEPYPEGEKLDSVRAAERLERIQAAGREAARPAEIFMDWYRARRSMSGFEDDYARVLNIGIAEARQRLNDIVTEIEISAAFADDNDEEGGSGDGETLAQKNDYSLAAQHGQKEPDDEPQ